ncbi:hypothetical protein ScalyP_jg4735 [Parmales sp. scaly parma]|nr:hypothetical protein ScalyP_jg4735 [Parmales sp. scaly parma]
MTNTIILGVCALQGAFEEHMAMIELLNHEPSTVGITLSAIQIKTAAELIAIQPATGRPIDGILLPGGESTAMGLIGTATANFWPALNKFINIDKRPTWGTCAGMILLANKAVGCSAVISQGQALVGGMDVTVCRNYFGSQISSFEMQIPMPNSDETYPAVFIRAPAILSVGEGVDVISKILATPCKQANAVLKELDKKLARGESVIKMEIVDPSSDDTILHDDKRRKCLTSDEGEIVLPGATGTGDAREIICAAKKENVLVTSFHPEITTDTRWHLYFLNNFVKAKEL